MLVVIDTLQQVRTLGSDNMSYASDYKDIRALKSISDKHDIAIICVHHLNGMLKCEHFTCINKKSSEMLLTSFSTHV